MNFKKTPSTVLLAIYLILVGFMGAFGVSLGALSIIVPCLAIAAGVLMLIGK